MCVRSLYANAVHDPLPSPLTSQLANLCSLTRVDTAGGPPVVFIDRSGECFEHVLRFLRGYPLDAAAPLQDLLADARYYGIPDLEEIVRGKMNAK
jgi:hypothetical protein